MKDKSAALPHQPNLFRQLRPFWTLAGSDFISTAGATLTLFAVEAWVYQQNSSVTIYASIHLLAVLPALVLSPLAGAWLDKVNRARVLIGCNMGRAIISLFLAWLAATRGLDTAILCFTAPLSATLGILLSLSFSAITVQLVPAEQ